MSTTREQLSALRRSLAKIEAAGTLAARAETGRDHADGGEGRSRGHVSLDGGALDAAAGGGLKRAALHEIVAERQADATPARGFATVVALRAASSRGFARNIVWVAHDQTLCEVGRLSAEGLAALGLDPAGVLLVQARDAVSALRAAGEAGKCQAVAAVVCEIWGAPKALDLKATRRLMLTAQRSGVTVILSRLGVTPQPSAAETRWGVSALASQALAANAPGRPAFSLTLLRHRHGVPAGPWPVEWTADDRLIPLQDLDRRAACGTDTALPGDRLPVSGDGPAAPLAPRRVFRLAG